MTSWTALEVRAGPGYPTPSSTQTVSAARALVEGFDPVLYAFVDVSERGEERELRWRRLAAKLLAEQAPEKAVATLAAQVAAAPPARATLAAFASADGALLHEQLMDDVAGDDAGYRAPPAVLPLLRWAQNRPAYVFVVIDRIGADIVTCGGASSSAWSWSVEGPDDEIERNAPGGWAQPRYQRRAEDSWRHNAGRVAEQVAVARARVGARLLVVSGDVRAVQLLRERLPRDPDLVVRQLSGSRARDGSQAARPRQIEVLQHDAGALSTARLLERFHEQFGPRGLAVEGVAATLDALAGDRVSTLVVATTADDARRAWFGAQPAQVYADLESARTARSVVASGQLADVAVRAALLLDADVRVVEPGTPGAPAEGLGALCRYRPT